MPESPKTDFVGPQLPSAAANGTQTAFEQDEFVSIKWIAERARLSRVTIRRHLDQAGVKPIRFGKARNATLRYRRSDVEQWLRSCWLA